MENITITWLDHEKCAAEKEATTFIPTFYILHFVFRGSGYCNGIRITAGQIFLIRPHTRATWMPDPDDPWDYGFINGYGTVLDRLIDDMNFDASGIRAMHNPTQVEALIDAGMVSENPDVHAGLVYSICCMEIAREQEPLVPLPLRHLQSAVRFIESQSGNTTAAAAADYLHLSRGYLRNLFMEHHGMSVQDYIMNCRMLSAAKMLTETEFPISMIAEIVGYSDPLLFSRMFRKKMALSPRAYRTEARRRATLVADSRAQGPLKTNQTDRISQDR